MEQLDRFKQKIIGHTLLKAAYSRLFGLIEEPAGAEVAALIGPSGSGKSTLLVRVHQAILKQRVEEMRTDPGLLPVVAVTAPASGSGSFDWRAMYLKVLEKLEEPACEWNLALKDRPSGKPGVVRTASLSYLDLQRRVELGFRHRGVKVLLVDEAQHMGKMASGRRLQDQTDVLKSLAMSTGTFVALFGTYDLIPLLCLNGQVARRFASVHLPRYRCDVPAEWRDFQTALRSFEAAIELGKAPDLVRDAELWYRGSAGCIGVLKDWLTRAYRQASLAGGEALTKDVIEATRLPTQALRTMAEEIVDGEGHWSTSHAEDQALDELLGLSCLHSTVANSTETRPAAAQRTPVGMRKPTRDRIGLEAAPV